MKKKQLQSLLEAEIEIWSRKSFANLVKELAEVVVYELGGEADFHQPEVQLLEHEPHYVHVSVSIDDGNFSRSIALLSHSFIVYRDGRVEK